MTPSRIAGRWIGFASLVTALSLAASGMAPSLASAQVSQVPEPGPELYEVQLIDGSVLIARVIAVDRASGRITFRTSGGTEVIVERAQVSGIRPAVGRIIEGQFWEKDPNDTRLYFTATGRSLAKGEGYAGTYLIVLPFAAYGVTDRFTIGGGAPVLFGEFEPFYITPKVQLLRSERANVSVGTIHFFFEDTDIGIAYGVGTLGSSDSALTVGIGFGYAGDDFLSEPVAMIGGETRVNRRIKLISENYILPDDTGVIVSGGIRYLGGRFGADVGVAGYGGDGGGGCCVPLLNFSYAFGGGN
jgi:hypothetical protein